MWLKSSPCLRKNRLNTRYWRPFWKSSVSWSRGMIPHTCVKRAGACCEGEVWVSMWRTHWAVLCCHPACDFSIEPDFKLNMKEFTKKCDCFVEKGLSSPVGRDVRCEPISVRSLSWRRNSNGPRPGSCRAYRKRIIVLQTECKRVKHPNK